MLDPVYALTKRRPQAQAGVIAFGGGKRCTPGGARRKAIRRVRHEPWQPGVSLCDSACYQRPASELQPHWAVDALGRASLGSPAWPPQMRSPRQVIQADWDL